MHTRNRILPLALLVGALSAQPATAGIFSAAADARLGYSLGAGALPSISFVHSPTTNLFDAANGIATLTQDGNDFVLKSTVSGNGEVTDSNTESDLVITIDNQTGNTVELTWLLSYSLDASAAYALAGESAYAEAFIDLFTDGYLLSGDADLNALLEADPDINGSPPNFADSLSFRLELLNGDLVEIALTIGTYGYASGSAVPAPPVLALFGLGLGVLGWRQRRRVA